MEIVLESLDPERWPVPSGWTVVGRVGRQALAYDPERRPHLVGDGEPVAVARDEVNAALVPAIDRAASKLWPGGWTYAVEAVFGIKRRGLAAERLARQGLPPTVLQTLARVSSAPDAEYLGGLILALARYADGCPNAADLGDGLTQALKAAERATEVVREARRGKPAWPHRLKDWLEGPQ